MDPFFASTTTCAWWFATELLLFKRGLVDLHAANVQPLVDRIVDVLDGKPAAGRALRVGLRNALGQMPPSTTLYDPFALETARDRRTYARLLNLVFKQAITVALAHMSTTQRLMTTFMIRAREHSDEALRDFYASIGLHDASRCIFDRALDKAVRAVLNASEDEGVDSRTTCAASSRRPSTLACGLR